MDLLSEASNGPRVLTARHISDIPPEINHPINTTLLCHTYSLQPDFASYTAVLKSNAYVIWSLGLLVVLIICVLYVVTLRSALRHWKDSKTSAAIVLAVYPLVASAAFLVTVVPRACILAEAIAQEAVMVAMYHFYFMVIAECGGVNQLVRKSLTWLRYLVLQMPVIQAFIYVIILILWAEDMMLYLNSLIYIIPFVAASILSGVWGVIMCIKTAEAVGAKPKPRFLALQLVLIIVKLQWGITKMLPGMLKLPCHTALHPSVFVNLIQSIVMMLEMLLLSIWAYRLYSVPPGKDADRVQHIVVAVLEDSLSTSDKTKEDKS
ncbi:organic solute transporter alpha protein [Danaus plexippus plexippus]|uniref:Organic solute transporter alpha protein n=1 Tax=Danaus plexippus plexippus TaxID=278856 RepID=A0A212F8U0_DANPL|nr:organic solute transporter alpha protein [Danaus plexippus plexippus]